MEILIATWSIRFAMIAAAGVGGLSFFGGVPPIESFDRAVAAAFVFILIGRFLMGRVMTPEQRVLLMRARREAGAGKKGKQAKGDKADKKAKGKKGKSSEADEASEAPLQPARLAAASRRAA